MYLTKLMYFRLITGYSILLYDAINLLQTKEPQNYEFHFLVKILHSEQQNFFVPGAVTLTEHFLI